MLYSHIFWDFDGTLFDTYPAISAAFCLALSERGITEPQQAVSARMQVSLGHAYNHYAALYSLDADFFARFALLRSRQEAALVCPFPHAKAVCEAVCAAGGSNYLFTHRDRSALGHMARFGMDILFRGCVTKEDGFPRKPAPDGLVHLLEKFGVDPADALMVGDRALDIESAANAGVRGCLFSPAGAACPGARYTIPSLSELIALLQL